MKLTTLFLAFLLTCGLSVQGQILYTDFVPDIYLNNQPNGTRDTAAVDINQDGVSDLTFIWETYFWTLHMGCCWVTRDGILHNPHQISFPYDSSGIAHYHTCSRVVLDSNMWIGPNFYYDTAGAWAQIYSSEEFSCGLAIDSTPKFYPFRQTINNDTLYGWIRIEPHPHYVIIYDAAINTVSNDSLYAGQITTGIKDINDGNSVKIIPNPFTNELLVNVNNHEPSEIILFDLVSRKIIQKKFSNSVSLNTEQLAKGIYIYEIQNKNGFLKKGKVVKD